MSSCIFGKVLKNIIKCQVSLIKRFPKRYYCSVKPKFDPTQRVWLGKLQTMKLESPVFHKIFTPELRKLIEIFEKYNHELRIAGGAVRDLLLEKTPHDIDFATTASPNEMQDMFEKENIRMLNNNGLKHGTVTARIDDKENFEVTTLRIDVVTDGRRAEVCFTKDWKIDANRRDLTINAMFLGFDGTVYDYFNGTEDLKNRRVKFVGDPVKRIQEDYLRILRYFRFYGRVAVTPNDHDESTIQDIRDNAKGLERVSGERIWMELKMILCGQHAAHIVLKMLEAGIGPVLGLPGKVDEKEVFRVFKNTEGLNPQPVTRLSALMDHEDQVYDFHARTKLSTLELKLGLFIVNQKYSPVGEDLVKHYKDLICDTIARESDIQTRVIELIKYRGHTDLLMDTESWTPPRFPVSGKSLIDKGISKGPLFAKILTELRNIWKESNYMLQSDGLTSQITELAEKYKDLEPKKKKMKQKLKE